MTMTNTNSKNLLKRLTKNPDDFFIMDVTYRKTKIYQISNEVLTAYVTMFGGGHMNIVLTVWSSTPTIGMTHKFSSADKQLYKQITEAALIEACSEPLPF